MSPTSTADVEPTPAPRLGALARLMEARREPPRFADAGTAIVKAFAEVAFPEKVTPMEAANRHRFLRNPGAYSGPWRDSPEPMQHLVQPTNNLAMTCSYSVLAIMGPSQMGKSEIGNNWQVHSVMYDPADIGFWLCDKNLIHSYVTTQIDKLLDECPDVKARQLTGSSADNIHLKQFRGCDWHFLWPTGSNFRARPFSRGRIDDLDDFDDDIGGQGDAVSLFEGRTTSFQGYGWKVSAKRPTGSENPQKTVTFGPLRRVYLCRVCMPPPPLIFG